MSELPAERPARRRVDESAADTGTLVDMGVVEPQPEPPPPPPPVEEPPPEPPPTEPEQETANLALLDAALVDSGVVKTTEDADALQKVATLDRATVETVARWVKRGKRDTATK